jgi:hypothetical protein
MPDDQVPLDYQCPVCGEKAVAGSHFCRQNAPPKTLKFKVAKGPRNTEGLVRLVAVAVVAVLLWSWVGPWSLLWVGLGTVGVLVWENRRR